MLLNGSSPPAVNWLRKFPAGYHDGGWHLRFAPAANGGHWKRQHPYLLPSPPLRLWLHEQADSFSPSAIPACSSPLSGLKVRICIQHSGVDETRCQACPACAAFHTYPSPWGFTYQSCRTRPEKIDTESSALRSWQRAPSMKWSKHSNYSSQSKDSIALMCQQDIFSIFWFPPIHRQTKIINLFVLLCPDLCIALLRLNVCLWCNINAIITALELWNPTPLLPHADSWLPAVLDWATVHHDVSFAWCRGHCL